MLQMLRHSALALVLAAGFLGCQQGTPAVAPAETADTSGAPVFGQVDATGAGLLMAGRLEVSNHGSEVSYTPIRSAAAIGNNFTLDGTGFLTESPCFDCMQVSGFALIGDTLHLDITVRHAFPSVTVRRDLDVFDPRVILVADPRDEWNYTAFPTVTYPRPDAAGGFVDTALAGNVTMAVGPAGYTTRFDERADDIAGREIEGNLNPYIDFALDLLPNDLASGPNPWRRLNQERGEETQSFAINLPPSIDQFSAVLLFEATWGQSSTPLTRLSPTYYNPEFNRKEAYRLEVAVQTATDGLAFGSQIPFTVAVEDWQAGGTVAAGYPDPLNTTGLFRSSEPSELLIAAPDWSAVPLSIPSASIGTGTPGDPYLYLGVLARDAFYPPHVGQPIPLLARIADQLAGTQLGETSPTLDLGQAYDIATYQLALMTPVLVAPPRLLEVHPTTLYGTTGLFIQTSPYLGSVEGSPTLEPFYQNEALIGGLFSAPPSSLRLMGAPIGSNLQQAEPPFPTAPIGQYAEGITPYDDYPATPAAHPSPDEFMPIRDLGATPHGDVIVGFGDDNFTIDPLRFPATGLTDRVANSAVAATWFADDNFVPQPGARLSEGCGSNIGPTFGSKVREAWAVDSGEPYGGFTRLLGYLSAGVNTEACGDFAQLNYFGYPYSSSADRAFTVDFTPLAVFMLTMAPVEADWRKFRGFTPGRLETSGAWYHYAIFDGNIIARFDVTEGMDGTRTSHPTIATLSGRNLGLSTAIDLAYIPYEPTSPFALSGVVQDRDWLLVLHKPGAGVTYALEALDATDVAMPTMAVEFGTTTWGLAFPPPTDVDFDPINQYVLISYDGNGAGAGGEILYTLMSVQ